MVKRAFVVWDDDSSESREELEEHEDVSMMDIEDNKKHLQLNVLINARSNDEDDAPEVTFLN